MKWWAPKMVSCHQHQYFLSFWIRNRSQYCTGASSESTFDGLFLVTTICSQVKNYYKLTQAGGPVRMTWGVSKFRCCSRRRQHLKADYITAQWQNVQIQRFLQMQLTNISSRRTHRMFPLWFTPSPFHSFTASLLTFAGPDKHRPCPSKDPVLNLDRTCSVALNFC